MNAYRNVDIEHVISKDIFIDANILISLWPPHQKISSFNSFCSRDLEYFKENNTVLFTDVVILSEFYNYWMRTLYNVHCQKNKLSTNPNNLNHLPFKKYRTMPEGKVVIDKICQTLEIILETVKLIHPEYSL